MKSSRLALSAYLLIAIAATWPLITHLQGYVPGTGDWGQNMWALWWTRQALLVEGVSPFFTTRLFHPEGVTLLFHPLDVADGLLTLPLYALVGGDVSYNLTVLLAFTLSGHTCYLLALHLTRHRLASFIAGLIFMLSPYHFLRLDIGHLNLVTLQWIPLFVLFVMRASSPSGPSLFTPLPLGGVWRGLPSSLKRVRLSGLAALLLVFIALHSWYYVIDCGLLAVALLIFAPTKNRSRWPILLTLTLAVLGLLPLLLPMLQHLSSTVFVGEHDPLRHSVDLLSFWIPGPQSSWGAWFEPTWIAYAAHDREPGASAYFGYTVLALTLLSLWGRPLRRQAIWWAAVGLGFTLLALGPQLQFNGQISEHDLPYALLQQVPIFSIAGIPGRFIVMTSLALAMMAALGLCQWPMLGQHRSRVSVIALLILIEYAALPIRLTATTLPDVYHDLASDPAAYALLDTKWDANYLLHAQTVHGKPLVGGWLARLPESQAAYLNQDSLDHVFLHLLLGEAATTSHTSDPATLAAAVQTALNQRQVRYIIDHDRRATPFLQPLLGWPIAYEDETLVVYENR